MSGSACLVLLHQGEGAVQRQDDPALGVRGVHLAGLLDGGDLGHATEEQQQVAALLRGVALVDALQHAQVRPRVQLLQAGRLLLRGRSYTCQLLCVIGYDDVRFYLFN